jgi:hypothetical protein
MTRLFFVTRLSLKTREKDQQLAITKKLKGEVNLCHYKLKKIERVKSRMQLD